MNGDDYQLIVDLYIFALILMGTFGALMVLRILVHLGSLIKSKKNQIDRGKWADE